MRTKIIIGICILVVAAGTYLFSRGVRAPSLDLGLTPEIAKEKVKGMEGALSPESSRNTRSEGTNASNDPGLSPNERKKALLPTVDELSSMADTPVEFYGQVLDQFDIPIAGAKITCTWGIYGQRVSPLELQSSTPEGKFEIVGIKAVAIKIFVEPPPGYAQMTESSRDVQIAKTPERILQNEDYKKLTPQQKEMMAKVLGAAEAFKADKAKPMIFRLRRL